MPINCSQSACTILTQLCLFKIEILITRLKHELRPLKVKIDLASIGFEICGKISRWRADGGPLMVYRGRRK